MPAVTVKEYLPLASVVVVERMVEPSLASRVTVTPEMPVSPLSWMPLPLASFQTKSPMVKVLCTTLTFRPASMVRSVATRLIASDSALPGLILLSLAVVEPEAFLVVKV